MLQKSQSNPKVSIIIVNYNSVDFLKNCLSSVMKTDYDNFEVLFVDNGSTEDDVNFVDNNFGTENKLKLIKIKNNDALTEAFNLGFRRSDGEYVVFMHSDTMVDPDWLKHLVLAMEKDTNIGAAQGKILSMKNTNIILSAGHTIDYWGNPMKAYGRFEEDQGQHDINREVFDAWDACMITRRSILNEIGLFDSIFYFANEEIDLCWRMQLAGYKILYAPKSKIWHKSEIISHSLPVEFTYYMYRNILLAYLKNYNIWNILRFIPIHLFLFISRMFIEFVLVNKNHSIAIFRAMLWILKNPKYILNERKKTQRLRKVSDSEIKKNMIKPSLYPYLSKINKRLKPFRWKGVIQ